MKTARDYIIIAVVLLVIDYAFFSLIEWNFKVSEWHVISRVIFAYVALQISIHSMLDYSRK